MLDADGRFDWRRVHAKKLIQTVAKKVRSYNDQDRRKGRLTYNNKYGCWNSPLLKVEEVIELIKTKGINCLYCDVECVFYRPGPPSRTKCPNLFTLDRIDNDKTHIISNCVVSCYRCNIMRSNAFTSEEYKKIKSRLKNMK